MNKALSIALTALFAIAPEGRAQKLEACAKGNLRALQNCKESEAFWMEDHHMTAMARVALVDCHEFQANQLKAFFEPRLKHLELLGTPIPEREECNEVWALYDRWEGQGKLAVDEIGRAQSLIKNDSDCSKELWSDFNEFPRQKVDFEKRIMGICGAPKRGPVSRPVFPPRS